VQNLSRDHRLTSMKISDPPIVDLAAFRLRPVELEDIPMWYEYLRLPHVVEHTSWNLAAESDLDAVVTRFNSTEAASPIRFAIEQIDSRQFAGTIGFHNISLENQTAEIGYDLHPDFWGRGIATTACKAVTSWGLQVRGFIQVQAVTLETNEMSKRVLRRSGFDFEKLLPDFRLVRGAPRNFLLFSRRDVPIATPAALVHDHL
jgi:RimJ/RimL family protein N-acetyltransferase